MSRKIVVLTEDAQSVDFTEVPAESEAELQRVLLANPQLLPSDDLGLDDDLLVIGRETVLASGSVDLLCLSRGGDVVIVEFKTGPQNPDFRHALAQVIDYGSDLWRHTNWSDFDQGVVQRFLRSSHVDPRFRECTDLRSAAHLMWSLAETDWEELIERLDAVLISGDFIFVVAAQRFTEPMKVSTSYLNEVTRSGRYFLVELVRLDAREQKAYAAQVVHGPAAPRGAGGGGVKASERSFLERVLSPEYRDALEELISGVRSLGYSVAWGSRGASIRLPSPDRAEPLSVGWMFLDNDGWYFARHVTLGVDMASLASHPSLARPLQGFSAAVGRVHGGHTATGKSLATVFEPDAFIAVRRQLIEQLAKLKQEAG